MVFPKISIITPVFNQAKLLDYTIHSLIDQKYPNLEYIIIDGGSTDGTIDVIQKYESKISYWISEPDNGMYDAIQKGFEHSSGEIMTWLNADDMYHKGALYTIAEIFSTFPEIEWLEGANTIWDNHYCGGRTVNVDHSRALSKIDFLMGDYHWIQQESTVWRRSLWEKTNGLDTSLKYAGDFALWLSFFRHAKLYRTNALIGGFRKWNKQQLSNSGIEKYEKECNNILRKEVISEKDYSIIKRYKKISSLNKLINKFKIRIDLVSWYKSKFFEYGPTIYYSFEDQSFKKI